MFVWLLLQCSFLNSFSWKSCFVSVLLSPTCPLSLISAYKVGWRCSVCTSLFSEQQKHYRVWFALCPLQTEEFSAKPPWLSPLLARAGVVTWTLTADFSPWGCSWPTSARQFQPETSWVHMSTRGTMELLSWKKNPSENAPSAWTRKNKDCCYHAARDECAELPVGWLFR